MAINIGDKAPDFITKDENGNEVKLSDFRGKKVAFYFYPNDMTEGCTLEACNLRDNYHALQKQGFEILGISSNDKQSHRKFIQKENLPFRLLADVDLSVHNKYETWIEKSMYGRKFMGTKRITFIIDEKGFISDIIGKVDTRNHAAQILGEEIAAKTKTPKKKVAAKNKK